MTVNMNQPGRSGDGPGRRRAQQRQARHLAKTAGVNYTTAMRQLQQETSPATPQAGAHSTPGLLLKAMTQIRVAAEIYMDERDSAELGWAEETVTDIAVHKGQPTVQVVQFNRRQEGGGVGADYLWWWLDSDGDDCFGMLVQAKKLDLSGTRPRVDISHRDGKQLGDLMRSAEHFEVPATYAVYTGGLVYRSELPCYHDQDPGCVECHRMTISLITALQVYVDWESPANVASELINAGISLENLVDPARTASIPFVLPELRSAALRDFVRNEQSGPREVAKRFFAEVVTQRNGAFSAALAEPMTLAGEPMFPDVPQDRGHYPAPYFEHVLRGLRHSPPEYVQDLLAGRAPSEDLRRRIAGVVLIRT
jgi:hypothetical protein